MEDEFTLGPNQLRNAAQRCGKRLKTPGLSLAYSPAHERLVERLGSRMGSGREAEAAEAGGGGEAEAAEAGGGGEAEAAEEAVTP